MKKLILWLIKIFKVNIPTEKIIINTIEIEKEVYLPKDGIIAGDIIIKGNVIIQGNLKVDGSLTINKII